MSGLDGHDRQINTFLIALLSKSLAGVAERTVQRAIEKHRQAIESAALLDDSFAKSLNEGAITKALNKSELLWEDIEAYADSIIERANRHDVSILNPLMPEYPKRLLLNKHYPPILYCRGDISILNSEKAVAIVGTREPTNLGRKMGHKLAKLLAEDGYVIVSGLAIGSDSAGHEGALDAGGKTIAVLPTPIDAPVYPKQNQALADRIVDNGGLLISEYAPGMELHGKQLIRNLVIRDEWQPGLSDGIVAIETSTTGGTKHALAHAIETKTPIAVFDYSTREGIDFANNERFSGNVDYIENKGAIPLYHPDSIDEFKRRMESYRAEKGIGYHAKAGGSNAEAGYQTSLFS